MAITDRRRLGNIGENAAAEHLRRRGFTILDRNYLKKWGEIDVVARDEQGIRFVEVKSVSQAKSTWDVTHETNGFRPEENVHPQKLRRLLRTIQTYLLEKHLDDIDWQLDVAIVLIDEDKREARVRMLENIIV